MTALCKSSPAPVAVAVDTSSPNSMTANSMTADTSTEEAQAVRVELVPEGEGVKLIINVVDEDESNPPKEPSEMEDASEPPPPTATAWVVALDSEPRKPLVRKAKSVASHSVKTAFLTCFGHCAAPAVIDG